MDLIGLVLKTAYIFGWSLLLQAAQQTWPDWAKSVEERMAQGRTTIKGIEERVTKGEMDLHDTQRSFQAQQAVVAKFIKAIEGVPTAIDSLSAKVDEIAAKQEQIQEAVNQLKIVKPEPEAGVPWWVGVFAALAVALIVITAIGFSNWLKARYEHEQDPSLQAGGAGDIVPADGTRPEAG